LLTFEIGQHIGVFGEHYAVSRGCDRLVVAVREKESIEMKTWFVGTEILAGSRSDFVLGARAANCDLERQH